MGVSVKDLVSDLKSCGIANGDHVIVHSSLSSIGWVDGGAAALIEALIQAVGVEGTTVFPTLTGSEECTPETPPHYDVMKSTCWTGAVPRTALAREDGIRSLHPTHSVKAFGRLAQWLTKGHEDVRTPCGFGSPYDKLADVGGKILLIGVTQESNTSFHHAEEISGVPYVIQNRPANVEIVDISGSKITISGTFFHLYGAERDYCALEPEMISRGICTIGKTGAAETKVMDAMRQREFLVNKLLVDPTAVLKESEKPKWQYDGIERKPDTITI
ncbi:MAG TPA: AAC(3) family N-acetyltransferase [Armatimonadota bacterium]